MRVWVAVLGLIISGISMPIVWAGGYGGHHNQTQVGVQLQGQEQYQGQSQDAEQENEQEVSITETHPKERALVKGSQALFVPQGNEGLAIQTPWGGPMITQGSQMAKLQALQAMAVAAGNADLGKLALDWAVGEAQPKRFLGIKGTENLCRNWLTALVCF